MFAIFEGCEFEREREREATWRIQQNSKAKEEGESGFVLELKITHGIHCNSSLRMLIPAEVSIWSRSGSPPCLCCPYSAILKLDFQINWETTFISQEPDQITYEG